MSTPLKDAPPLTRVDFHLVREPGMEPSLVTGLRLTHVHRCTPMFYVGRRLVPNLKKAGVDHLRHALYGPLPQIIERMRYLTALYDPTKMDSDAVLREIDGLVSEARDWMNAEPERSKMEDTPV
jgi:hypothetical protein